MIVDLKKFTQKSAFENQQFAEVDIAAAVIQTIVRRSPQGRRWEESPNSAGQCAG
jgi:hypothetical protein